MTVVAHLVKTEVIPLAGRQQRIDDKAVPRTRTEPAEACDNQIVESAVIVIAAAFLISFEPIARGLVEIFADVGFSPVVLALHILLQFGEIEAVAYHGTAVIIEVVGQGCECLGRGERPHSTIPFAFSHTVGTELRMAALGGSLSVGSGKTLWVATLPPCLCVFGVVGRQIEVPRNEADSLTHIGERIFLQHLEKVVAVVP